MDGPISLALDQWAAAFRLSGLWAFKEVEIYIKIEMDVIATRDPVGCIEAANLKTSHLREWVIKAYKSLCEREQPLSVDEAARHTLGQAITICNIREALKSRTSMGTKAFDLEASLKAHEALLTPQVIDIGMEVKAPSDAPQKHPKHYQSDFQELLVSHFDDSPCRTP